MHCLSQRNGGLSGLCQLSMFGFAANVLMKEITRYEIDMDYDYFDSEELFLNEEEKNNEEPIAVTEDGEEIYLEEPDEAEDVDIEDVSEDILKEFSTPMSEEEKRQAEIAMEEFEKEIES